MNQVLSEEKVKISRKTVHLTIKRFKTTGSSDIITTVSKEEKLSVDHLNYCLRASA